MDLLHKKSNVEEFKFKIQLVVLILQYDGLFLKETSSNLNKIEEIVFEAVKQNGMLIQFLGDNFKENPVIAIEAVKQTKGAAQFVRKLVLQYIFLAIDKEITYEDAKKEIDNEFQIDYEDFPINTPHFFLEKLKEPRLNYLPIKTRFLKPNPSLKHKNDS
jgi:hypothetical protein